MVDEGDLVTALIAKLASNDLGMVDQFTEKRQSSGIANRLDPMSFVRREQPVMPVASPAQISLEQQVILEQTNRMAEQLCPLPPPLPVPPPEPQRSSGAVFSDTSFTEFSVKLDNINDSLQLISNTLLVLVDVLKHK
jgi:hypothetical protein